jgi:hypothetical protein
MPFSRITICLTVEEKNAPEVSEALLSQIDLFAVNSICVFDSDLQSQSVDIANADDLRRELTGVRGIS